MTEEIRLLLRQADREFNPQRDRAFMPLRAAIEALDKRVTQLECARGVDEIEREQHRLDDDGCPPVRERVSYDTQEERLVLIGTAVAGDGGLYWGGQLLRRGLRVEVNDVPPTTHGCPQGWYTIVGVNARDKFVQVKGELDRNHMHPLFWISADRIVCLGREVEV